VFTVSSGLNFYILFRRISDFKRLKLIYFNQNYTSVKVLEILNDFLMCKRLQELKKLRTKT
jgi:hypothetical protein